MPLLNIFILISLILRGIEPSNYFEKITNVASRLNLVYYQYGISLDFSTSRTTTSLCKCKSMCDVLPNCMAVAMKARTNGTIGCRTTEKPIYQLRLKQQSKWRTYAKDAGIMFVGNDGVFYNLASSYMMLGGAQRYCQNNFENGKLFTPKTDLQIRDVMKFLGTHGISTTEIWTGLDNDSFLILKEAIEFNTNVIQTSTYETTNGGGFYAGIHDHKIGFYTTKSSEMKAAICEVNPKK